MKDMNDLLIEKMLAENSSGNKYNDVLKLLFNTPIEKIQNPELRTVAITTRQSFEILVEMIDKISQNQNQQLNGLSA